MVEMEIRRFEPLEYRANEAINTLCTNLFFAGGDIRKIMITSCRPHEGKSFIAMNLMRSLAGLGMKVILVDADIRASALQGEYGIRIQIPERKRYMGLSAYLAGQCGMEDIVAKTNIPNAYMILAGGMVSNSLALLSTPRLKTLLDELAAEYDVVLVDSTPVGAIVDAAQVASVCDGTLFVVQSGTIRGQELQQNVQQIQRTGSLILGYVLNQHDEPRNGSYGYYRDSYSYGYGSSNKKGKRKG